MTKAQLITDLQSIAGFIAINADVIDKTYYSEDKLTKLKEKGHFEVEYTDVDGKTTYNNIYYVNDLVANTAKYSGGTPVFQSPTSVEETNRLAMEAYFASKNTWKAFFVEYIDYARKFAVLTTIQKDTANKFYTQRVLVIDTNGYNDKNIEPSTYVPV